VRRAAGDACTCGPARGPRSGPGSDRRTEQAVPRGRGRRRRFASPGAVGPLVNRRRLRDGGWGPSRAGDGPGDASGGGCPVPANHDPGRTRLPQSARSTGRDAGQSTVVLTHEQGRASATRCGRGSAGWIPSSPSRPGRRSRITALPRRRPRAARRIGGGTFHVEHHVAGDTRSCIPEQRCGGTKTPGLGRASGRMGCRWRRLGMRAPERFTWNVVRSLPGWGGVRRHPALSRGPASRRIGRRFPGVAPDRVTFHVERRPGPRLGLRASEAGSFFRTDPGPTCIGWSRRVRSPEPAAEGASVRTFVEQFPNVPRETPEEWSRVLDPGAGATPPWVSCPNPSP
jgi:hypothetical protein